MLQETIQSSVAFPNFKRVFLETMFLKFVGRIEKIYLTDWLEILTDSFIR